MSDRTPGADDVHRLNLEQQKRRAKELHGALVRGERDALARVLAHHPKAHGLRVEEIAKRFARLSDAQVVIARELGLPSWPRLKAHAERFEQALSDIASGAPAPDAGCPTRHIRCGSDIREGLLKAGFTGEFLEFSDPYCQGPVLATDALLRVRARFIADAYELPLAHTEQRLTAEYDALSGAVDSPDRVVLWFEHDSYDQLILARVLAAFAARRRTAPLELICVGRYPGIARFKGLGQLSAPALRSLWESRTPVSEAQLRLGAEVWAALQADSPVKLQAIASNRTPALAPMAGAIERHLQELPWSHDGLSLTQRLALQLLEDGPRTGAALFEDLNLKWEPLPFLGDTMFWAVLKDMQRASDPPFRVNSADDRPWDERVLSLARSGEALIAGRLDWMSLNPPERWVGGVRIVAGTEAWRWSIERQHPVPAN